MRIAIALLAIAAATTSLTATAVLYTEEPDPAYDKAGIALFCMNHFYNRTKGPLGMQAGMAAQEDLATQLTLLPNGQKLADKLRVTLTAITEDESSNEVSPSC